ncbi:hypothetical protein DFH07DRAFT_772483 [Mycena maculata]|uniref:Uncharacterized protein n=1 Tax=Mycena maculata TaxID=230809 RepID=A0AAD7JA99_9AGAR|nr:hypothetical protein DFH07DRAFT_772483 [Mycena maculata]
MCVECIFIWKDHEKTTYSQRMKATDIHGLSIPPIRASCIMQDANSLIGRQLKAVIQTGVFQILIHLKIKLHLLTHLPDDAHSLGPLIGVATEIFESFNGVFRTASVLWNHRAPSWDIARQLANQEGARSLALGCSWFNAGLQEWRSPAPSIKRFMDAQPNLKKRMMGFECTQRSEARHNETCSTSYKRGGDAKAPASNCELGSHTSATFLQVRSLACWWGVASCKDLDCKEWGLLLCQLLGFLQFIGLGAHNLEPTDTAAGRILELLVSATDRNTVLAVVDHFNISATKHVVYSIPQLFCRNGRKDKGTQPVCDPASCDNIEKTEGSSGRSLTESQGGGSRETKS